MLIDLAGAWASQVLVYVLHSWSCTLRHVPDPKPPGTCRYLSRLLSKRVALGEVRGFDLEGLLNLVASQGLEDIWGLRDLGL